MIFVLTTIIPGDIASIINGQRKPVIYFYPENEEHLTITLVPQGKVTESIPPYSEGWTVDVKPNGIIDDEYRYLFYETEIYYSFTLNHGWVIPRKDFVVRMESILKQIGLNEQEKLDFIEYWDQALSKEEEYYAIYYLLPDEIEEAVELKISKKPDSLLRAHFYFKPLRKSIVLEEPKVTPFVREGFTVVEWGGILKE